jgi:uncharacterized protein YybS (DUF2232 family)
MNQGSSTRALVEAGLFTAIAVILIFITIYIPIFLFIGMFLWPIPITIIYIRHGFKYSFLSLIATGIITAMIFGPIRALTIVLVFGFMGLVLGYCIKNKKSGSVTIAIMSAVMFFSLAANYMIYVKIIGQDIINLALVELEKNMELMKQTYANKQLTKEQADTLKALYDIDFARMVIPSTFIMGSVIMSFLSYVISGKLLRKPFSEWYMHTQIAFGIMAIVLIGFIFYQSDKNEGLKYLYNSQLIFQYSFTLIGMSVVAYLFKKRGMSTFLSAVIIFFLLSTPIFFNFLMIIGIIDYTFDWRKLDPKRQKRKKDI